MALWPVLKGGHALLKKLKSSETELRKTSRLSYRISTWAAEGLSSVPLTDIVENDDLKL